MSEEQNDIVPRIGTFFLLLGIFFFIFFLASNFARQTDFDWLFLSVLLLAVGFGLRRRASPPPPAGRFSGIQKMRKNAKKRNEEKAKKK